LAFLYNSGARVQEALDLSVSALQLDRPYRWRLVAKAAKSGFARCGRKRRHCARARDRTRIGRDGSAPVFVTRTGSRSLGTARHIVTRYVTAAIPRSRHSVKTRAPAHVSTRVCRTSSSSGVELNMIRHWLGHVSLETTQRYAKLISPQKRRALDAVTPVGSQVGEGRDVAKERS